MGNSRGTVVSEYIDTKRLRLKPSTLADLDALANRDRVRFETLIGATSPDPFEPPPETADALELFQSKHAEDPASSPWLIRWIIERAERRLVGSVGFIGPPDQFGVLQFGYSIYPADQNRGYATEAANGLTTWACRQPNVQHIQAAVRYDNWPSQRVAIKSGFTFVREIESEHEGLMGVWELRCPHG